MNSSQLPIAEDFSSSQISLATDDDSDEELPVPGEEEWLGAWLQPPSDSIFLASRSNSCVTSLPPNTPAARILAHFEASLDRAMARVEAMQNCPAKVTTFTTGL